MRIIRLRTRFSLLLFSPELPHMPIRQKLLTHHTTFLLNALSPYPLLVTLLLGFHLFNEDCVLAFPQIINNRHRQTLSFIKVFRSSLLHLIILLIVIFRLVVFVSSRGEDLFKREVNSKALSNDPNHDSKNHKGKLRKMNESKDQDKEKSVGQQRRVAQTLFRFLKE